MPVFLPVFLPDFFAYLFNLSTLQVLFLFTFHFWKKGF
ncbi:hypothetical protein MmTuc01_2245 [Methanosarcina mazei Tuc01]|uniref:Uncharacterized protein n=1 Tax=Methanosarcina mazei Tuc01 TaxID=1236903 RepID=M1PAM9_METMZ|nr:hypothetical protein MmTuc01_2245 [Methanosarcina mazei Tuc01]